MSAMTMKVTHLLELERAKQLAVLLGPVGGHVALAGGLLDVMRDLRRAIEIVDFEADDREQVGLVEEPLRVGEAEKTHLRVVLIKT